MPKFYTKLIKIFRFHNISENLASFPYFFGPILVLRSETLAFIKSKKRDPSTLESPLLYLIYTGYSSS